MSNQYSTIAFIITITALLLLLVVFIISTLNLYQKNKLLFQKNIEEFKAKQEKDLLQAQLEVQEQTFQHISREIHDNVAHNLALSKFNLHNLNYADSVTSREKIDSAIHIIGDVIQSLRNLSKSLHSDIIKESGLFHAMENEISIVRKTGFYKISYVVTGEPCNIHPDRALILFRIIQESLNNIIKHSKASEIRLELHFDERNLQVSIEDNGTGFILKEDNGTKTFGGAGLKNIRQRAKMLDGQFEIISSVGQGTKVKISIPLTNS